MGIAAFVAVDHRGITLVDNILPAQDFAGKDVDAGNQRVVFRIPFNSAVSGVNCAGKPECGSGTLLCCGIKAGIAALHIGHFLRKGFFISADAETVPFFKTDDNGFFGDVAFVA